MLSRWWRRERPAPPEGDVRCSFCKKGQHDVRKLIAGPGVVICDECVEVCNDILADDHRFTSAERVDVPDISSSQVEDFPVVCRLCGMQVLAGEALLIEARGMVCAPCAAAVVDAMDVRSSFGEGLKRAKDQI